MIANPAMEPAKNANDAKAETLVPVTRLAHWVNRTNLRASSIRALSRISQAIQALPFPDGRERVVAGGSGEL